MSQPGPVIPSLATYSLLGRSGLRVSPLCLGTMTFGTEWGWGCPEETARAIFQRYVHAGGNFIDTADRYTGGTSERLVGQFMRELGNRESLVVATKFNFCTRPGDPNGSGNGRKHIIEACEASLRRLGTDYIDLYWLHAWDSLTPVEEVMGTLDALVRAGKVRYLGFSDVPAWYAARAQTLAEWRGWERVCALQMEYSLIERNIEREFVAMAQQLGMAICPWSPLGGGLLTGKYRPGGGSGGEGEGRLQAMVGSPNPAFRKFTERNFAVLEVLLGVARELGRSPAQVALRWVATRPGVTSTLVGASTLGQLGDNLGALEAALPKEHQLRLDEASALPPIFPYVFFDPALQEDAREGVRVVDEPAWFRGR